jgi:NADH:ubiquinone reductase (non-electrogenic)
MKITSPFCVYRIGVDEWLRAPSVQDVFSIGDCSGFLESTGKPTLPALAQVSYECMKYKRLLLVWILLIFLANC